MLPLNISQADAMTANIVRKKDKSSLVRDRMHAIYLLYEGYDRQTCAHIIGCRPNTITDYIRLYNKEGLEGLRRLKYHKPETKLLEYQSAIQESLKELKPSTISEIRDHIHEKYGIDRSPERIRVFVKRIGLKYRKVGTLPGGKDVDKWLVEQADFLKLTLKPLIDKALSKEIDLLFSDAAHFVQGKFSTYLWSEHPMYAPSSSGRYRINILSGLDIANNAILSLYNDHYVSAETVVEYLEWLRQDHYKDIKRPLYLVLDNARYQKCDLVALTAKRLKVELIYLPAYSPNLNLIERLWKHMKKVLARNFFPDKSNFLKAIENLLDLINTEDYKEKLQSLFNIEFQAFDKSRILTW
jgi:transposase